MIRIFYPGKDVPEWLIERKVDPKGVEGSLRFSCFAVVYNKNGIYNIRNLLGETVMTLSPDARGVCLISKGPKNDRKNLRIKSDPLINKKTFFYIAFFALSFLILINK